jgi:hypothetical protein
MISRRRETEIKHEVYDYLQINLERNRENPSEEN